MSITNIVIVTGIPKRFSNTRPIVSGPAVDPPACMVKLIPIPTVTAPIIAESSKLGASFESGVVKNRNSGKIIVGIMVLTINSCQRSNQPISITIVLKTRFDTKRGSPVKLRRMIVVPVTPPKARLCGERKRFIPIARIKEPVNRRIKVFPISFVCNVMRHKQCSSSFH